MRFCFSDKKPCKDEFTVVAINVNGKTYTDQNKIQFTAEKMSDYDFTGNRSIRKNISIQETTGVTKV